MQPGKSKKLAAFFKTKGNTGHSELFKCNYFDID